MKRLISILMALSMVFCFIPSGEFAYAADETEEPVQVYLTEDIFPDKAFRTWLTDKFEGNDNQALDEEELRKLTLVEIPKDLGIKSVKGIEQLPYLERLTIPYQVSGMEEMQADLYIKSSYTGYLDISGCSLIEELRVDAAPTSKVYITGIDITGCTGLEELILPNCYDLKELKGLKTLTSLKNIEISKYGKLQGLDVSGNTVLERLVINGNPLKSVNVTNCPKLEMAIIGGKSPDGEETVSHIDFSGCTSLKSIYLASPGLRTIDISDCKGLENIQIDKDERYSNYAKLKSLDLSVIPELEGVTLTATGLETLDLTKNTKLEGIGLERNGLKELKLGNCPDMTTLRVVNEKLISLDISGCPHLSYALDNSEGIVSGDLKIYNCYDPETEGMIDLTYDVQTKLIFDGGYISPRRKMITAAVIKLSKTVYDYNGTVRKPSVTAVTLDGITLEKGRDYTVSYATGRKNAGTYKVTVKGINRYTGTSYKTFTIRKIANTLKVTPKTAKVKYTKLKKANQTVTRKNVLTVTGAKGTVTYKKMNGAKKILINKTTGKVTVKKGLKKGTYKVKVNVKAAGTVNYKPMTKTVTFKIKVS